MSFRENLAEEIRRVENSRNADSGSVTADEAVVEVEPAGAHVRVRVSFDANASGMAESLTEHHESLAEDIHGVTEETLNSRKTLERVPRTAMFTAKY